MDQLYFKNKLWKKDQIYGYQSQVMRGGMEKDNQKVQTNFEL